jgi:hypothetical protein
MTREEAALIEKVQNERKIDLSRLTSYPEYYVLREELDKMLKAMDSNKELDFESKIPIEIQAVAYRFATKHVEKFLVDMGVYSKKAFDSREATYE